MKRFIYLTLCALSIACAPLSSMDLSMNTMLKVHHFKYPKLLKDLSSSKESRAPFLVKEEPEELSLYLKHYVSLLLDCHHAPYVQKQMSEFVEQIRVKAIQDFPRNLLAISPTAFFKQLEIEFDFDFKYKGIRSPKNELPPILNFTAREALPPEGFEAGEILNSIIPIHPQWNLFASLGLYEQWVSELMDYQKQHHLENTLSALEDFENRFKGTMKYGMGFQWNFVTKAQKKLRFEAIWQQKTSNEWVLKQYLLSSKGVQGMLFDHLKFTFTFDF